MSAVASDAVPGWLNPLLAGLRGVDARDLSRFVPPADGSGRRSAVLMLFAGQTFDTADLLLVQRSAALRHHPGQVAFPGGGAEAADSSASATALREAAEEAGVRGETVEVIEELPAIFLPVSANVVTPVLGWWRRPHPVAAVDDVEVAAVHRVSLPELVDPQRRFTVAHPSGVAGPGFSAGGLFIWGFTAGLIDRLLRIGGWERPWDASSLRPLPTVADGHIRDR